LSYNLQTKIIGNVDIKFKVNEGEK
jgi:hypothetical protein